MKSRSFRVVPGRLIPRRPWYKQALLASALILAGCGGSAHAKPTAVRGHGFSFNAPAGWKVTTSRDTAMASHGSELLQVSTFPLIRPYRDALFNKINRELSFRMQRVSAQVHGTVISQRVVTVDGSRSHSFNVVAGSDTLEYTFLLKGKREFQLLCRRPTSGADDNCRQLLTSFAA